MSHDEHGEAVPALWSFKVDGIFSDAEGDAKYASELAVMLSIARELESEFLFCVPSGDPSLAGMTMSNLDRDSEGKISVEVTPDEVQLRVLLRSGASSQVSWAGDSLCVTLPSGIWVELTPPS
jgi:hypothetical protein